jgi:hypothetical protein
VNEKNNQQDTPHFLLSNLGGVSSFKIVHCRVIKFMFLSCFSLHQQQMTAEQSHHNIEDWAVHSQRFFAKKDSADFIKE